MENFNNNHPYSGLSTWTKLLLCAMIIASVIFYGFCFYCSVAEIVTGGDPFLNIFNIVALLPTSIIMGCWVVITFCGAVYGVVTLFKFVWKYFYAWSLLLLLLMFVAGVCMGGLLLTIKLVKELIQYWRYRKLTALVPQIQKSREEKRKQTRIIVIVLVASFVVGLIAGLVFTETNRLNHVHTHRTLEAVPATCIQDGLTEGTICSTCGTIIEKQVVIPAECTTLESIPEKEPTCQETGLTEGQKCDLCGKIVVAQEILPKVSCENFESSEIEDVKPSKTQDGKSHTECEICGKVLNEYIHGAGSQGLKYELNGDDTYTVVGIGSCTDKELVIPKTYYNLPVTSIADGAFSYCNSLSSVVIHDGITTISYDAFSGCSSLTNVTIPSTVTLIDEYAFYDCRQLEKIVFNGTTEQWRNISKGNVWDYWSGEYTVYCTNGTILKGYE